MKLVCSACLATYRGETPTACTDCRSDRLIPANPTTDNNAAG